MKNIEPKGLSTGLQELLAVRIHLARDHGIYHDALEAAELRIDEAVNIELGETIYVDVEHDIEWLSRPPAAMLNVRRSNCLN